MQPFTKIEQFFGLIASLGVSFLAAAIGAVASIRTESFYGELIQPDWAPPASVFGPVWTFLYTLMGIAAWLVWRSGGFQANKKALLFFLAQLALNALWSWIFFAWKLGGFAFVDILALWILILVTIIFFWQVRPIAGILLIPYWAWVTFAAVLNFSIWKLNPQILG
ncbi:MAG TPA: TspO/MBR family protein [Opitutales bacterium]|nr:TspO/MBR family protein [Opitutales bacterium]